MGGSIRFVLLKSPGSPIFDISINSEDIILAIHKQKGI
ncbi:3-dehydroquinate synthase [Leptospira interrogans]|nr:3-dehydroquinate synthase [Leptospira interrogans]